MLILLSLIGSIALASPPPERWEFFDCIRRGRATVTTEFLNPNTDPGSASDGSCAPSSSRSEPTTSLNSCGSMSGSSASSSESSMTAQHMERERRQVYSATYLNQLQEEWQIRQNELNQRPDIRYAREFHNRVTQHHISLRDNPCVQCGDEFIQEMVEFMNDQIHELSRLGYSVSEGELGSERLMLERLIRHVGEIRDTERLRNDPPAVRSYPELALIPSTLNPGVINTARMLALPTVTARSPIRQSLRPEAIAARAPVQAGARIYRIGTRLRTHTGRHGQFWSLENPLRTENYTQRYGIPSENAQFNFVEFGRIRPNTPFVTRPAAPVGENPGGAIEVVVPEGGVNIEGHFSL